MKASTFYRTRSFRWTCNHLQSTFFSKLMWIWPLKADVIFSKKKLSPFDRERVLQKKFTPSKARRWWMEGSLFHLREVYFWKTFVVQKIEQNGSTSSCPCQYSASNKALSFSVRLPSFEIMLGNTACILHVPKQSLLCILPSNQLSREIDWNKLGIAYFFENSFPSTHEVDFLRDVWILSYSRLI